MDQDYYKNFNGNYSELQLAVTTPSHPWTGAGNPESNNKIAGSIDDDDLAKDFGISVSQLLYLRDRSQFIFCKKMLKMK